MHSRKMKTTKILREGLSLDNQDRDSINEWLIISFEWQIPIIIYE